VTVIRGYTGWKGGVYVPPNALNPPTNLVATATGATSIQLAWDAPTDKADATGYRVYEVLSGGERQFVGFSTWGFNVLNVIGLDPETFHTYEAVTTDGSTLVSGPSNQASATTDAVTTAGDGILFDNPKTATGYRFDDPQDKPAETGDGILFDNPKTNSGYRFADPALPTPDPVPVAAPTITQLYATGTTTLQLVWKDNQTDPSDSFLIYCAENATGDLIYQRQVPGTDSSHQISLLDPGTAYKVTMTAVVGAEVSGLSNIATASTSSDVGGTFVPNIANINFEALNVGDQIVGYDDGTTGFTGVGTGTGSFGGSSNRQWYAQEYIDANQPAQNMTNVDDKNPRSGSKCGVIYVVRKDEPTQQAGVYNSAMGVNCSLASLNHKLYKGDEYWERYDLYLPPDFNPHTKVSTLKMVQNKTLRGTDGSNTGASFFNIIASSGVYPGGWCFDTSEIDKTGDGQTNFYYVPASHPWAGDAWRTNTTVIPDNACWDRGKWMSIEVYQYLSNDLSEGRCRMWVNNNLVADRAMRTLRNADDWMDHFKLFAYWNGARDDANTPKFGSNLFAEPAKILIDNYMATDQNAAPTNKDSQGNLFIGDIHTTAPPVVPPPTPDDKLIFFDDFASGDKSKTMNGFSWTSSTPGKVNVTTDNPYSGTHSMKFTFVSDLSDNNAIAEQRFNLGTSYKEIWFQYRMFIPSNYERYLQGAPEVASVNHKQFYLWDSDNGGYGNGAKMGMETWPKAAGTTAQGSAMWRSNPVYTTLHNFFPQNDFIVPADLGTWVTYKHKLRVADEGQSNGQHITWKNGAKIAEFLNVDNGFSGENLSFNNGYLLGHMNGGFKSTIDIYLDEIAFATKESLLPYTGAFTPDHNITFSDGVVGQQCVGTADSFDAESSNLDATQNTFSDEVTPWSGTLVGKCIRRANKFDWGGHINRVRGQYVVGDEFWIRTVTWYPVGFQWCSGCTEGVKFHRMYIDPTGTGNWGFYLEGPTGMGVSSSVGTCSRKEFYSRYNQWADQSASNGFPPCEVQQLVGHEANKHLGPAVPEGEWVLHETYIKLDPVYGEHRYYTNGELVFEETGIKTCDAAIDYLDAFSIWTYHNGGNGLAQDHAYIDSITITGGDNPPPNIDPISGKPIIGTWKP
jgi:hypothetical protein